MTLKFKIKYEFIILSVAIALLSACQASDPETYSEQSIFTDQRRKDIATADAPYIFALQQGCSGFLIDAEKLIGITAAHCLPALDMRICLQAKNAQTDFNNDQCEFPGRISAILDRSPFSEFDLVVVQLFAERRPKNLGALRVGSEANLVRWLATKGSEVNLIGYPSDIYRKGNLTSSSCSAFENRPVSSRPDKTTKKIDIKKAFAYWESKNLIGTEAYNSMLHDCDIILGSGPPVDNLFSHSCSTYGGNSGGPFVFKDVAFALPFSYLRSPSDKPKLSYESVCFQKHWDTFFKPAFGEKPALSYLSTSPGWNSLNTGIQNSKLFPQALRFKMLETHMPFFKEHPEYLSAPPRILEIETTNKDLINLAADIAKIEKYCTDAEKSFHIITRDRPTYKEFKDMQIYIKETFSKIQTRLIELNNSDLDRNDLLFLNQQRGIFNFTVAILDSARVKPRGLDKYFIFFPADISHQSLVFF